VFARPAAGGARLLTSRLAGTLAPPVADVLRLVLRTQPRSENRTLTQGSPLRSQPWAERWNPFGIQTLARAARLGSRGRDEKHWRACITASHKAKILSNRFARSRAVSASAAWLPGCSEIPQPW